MVHPPGTIVFTGKKLFKKNKLKTTDPKLKLTLLVSINGSINPKNKIPI